MVAAAFDSSGVDSKTRGLRQAQAAEEQTEYSRRPDRGLVESKVPNSSGSSLILLDFQRHTAHKSLSISLPLGLASCRLIRHKLGVNGKGD